MARGLTFGVMTDCSNGNFRREREREGRAGEEESEEEKERVRERREEERKIVREGEAISPSR